MLSQTLVVLGFCGMLVCCQDSVGADEHPVDPDELVGLVTQADKIVVFSSDPLSGPTAFSQPTVPKVLFSSTDPKDIAEFKDAVTVVRPTSPFHCMCDGTLHVQLHRGDTRLFAVSNHHGRSVRCSLWTSDALLKDPEKWIRWFDARKMPEPRKEVEKMRARAQERAVSLERWLAATPKSVRPFWGSVDVVEPNVEPLELALAKELPDIRERVLASFAWYGSGAGPWNGHPAYESVAESLLLGLPTSDLIAVAENAALTEVQLEGAARLFSGYKFSKLLRESRKELSDPLKEKLLNHSLKSADGDKVSRAKDAFGP